MDQNEEILSTLHNTETTNSTSDTTAAWTVNIRCVQILVMIKALASIPQKATQGSGSQVAGSSKKFASVAAIDDAELNGAASRRSVACSDPA